MNFKNKRFKIFQLLLFIATVVISIFLGTYIVAPPPLPNDFTNKIITVDEIKNKNEPSLDMAMSHVYNIAQNSHPSGSEEILKTRKYILDEIEKADLEYQIQNFHRDLLSEAVSEYRGGTAENVEFNDDFAKKEGFETYEEFLESFIPGNTEYKNILVKIGPDNSKHNFLMVAHYDSVKWGPGAADDGIAVASLLETMRVLKSQNNSKNTVYFLLTDGEELGLIGSDYYCKNPIIPPDTVDLVVNFEAHGNKGVPFMFETSNNNKQIVKFISENISKNWMFSWFV